MNLDDFQTAAGNLIDAAEKALEALDTFLVDNYAEDTQELEDTSECQTSFEELIVSYRTLVQTTSGGSLDRTAEPRDDKKAE